VWKLIPRAFSSLLHDLCFLWALLHAHTYIGAQKQCLHQQLAGNKTKPKSHTCATCETYRKGLLAQEAAYLKEWAAYQEKLEAYKLAEATNDEEAQQQLQELPELKQMTVKALAQVGAEKAALEGMQATYDSHMKEQTQTSE
jgi:hypothetical protein